MSFFVSAIVSFTSTLERVLHKRAADYFLSTTYMDGVITARKSVRCFLYIINNRWKELPFRNIVFCKNAK